MMKYSSCHICVLYSCWLLIKKEVVYILNFGELIFSIIFDSTFYIGVSVLIIGDGFFGHKFPQLYIYAVVRLFH